MLTFSFFTAVFATIVWLISAVFYISARLVSVDLTAISLMDMSLYVVIVFLPLLTLWSIWGKFYNLRHEAGLQKQFTLLSLQINQNQEYIDAAARILLKGTQQQAHVFALGKIELYISEMNEILADILQRYHLLSEEKLRAVWNLARLGNRWGFAKALVDLRNNTADFDKKLAKAAQEQSLLAGSLKEFCARYTRLLGLLKDHDEENILQDIIETGVFGKVFAFFAPITRNLNNKNYVEEKNVPEKQLAMPIEKNIEESFIEEPVFENSENEKAKEPVVEEQTELSDKEQDAESKKNKEEISEIFVSSEENVAESVEAEENDEEENSSDKPSFWSRLLGIHEDEEEDKNHPDPLRIALERSFGTAEEKNSEKKEKTAKKSQSEPKVSEVKKEEYELSDEDKAKLDEILTAIDVPDEDDAVEKEIKPKKSRFAFANTNKTIKNLQKEWEEMKKNDKVSADEENV
ncbi:MAG: hypothetical protein MR368_05965 [Azospirillum sp.]|nr:hypothetical protein [Azospirillum sp.]